MKPSSEKIIGWISFCDIYTYTYKWNVFVDLVHANRIRKQGTYYRDRRAHLMILKFNPMAIALISRRCEQMYQLNIVKFEFHLNMWETFRSTSSSSSLNLCILPSFVRYVVAYQLLFSCALYALNSITLTLDTIRWLFVAYGIRHHHSYRNIWWIDGDRWRQRQIVRLKIAYL